jgi:hypothetical protein
MTYQLRNHEALGEGLRRICHKQIDLALAIARNEKEAQDTPVHDMRKHLKKARAVLRVVRKEIGRGLFRQQDHTLRDVGRLISDIRDAEVRLQTVRQIQGLSHRGRRAAYRQLETVLTLELENFIAAFAEWQTQAVPLLERALALTDQWQIDQFTSKQLRRAIQRSYKRARNALADVRRDPSPATYHQFRTKTKVLAHQLRVLRPLKPVVLKNLGDDLDAVGDLLGRAHDLSFLAERLRNEKGQANWQRQGQKLLAVIEVSQADLERGAAELAERFFAERARDFGKHVAGWLDSWVKTSSGSVAEALVS